MRDIPQLTPVAAVIVRPSPRILELFNKPGMLTADEWAELELYESMQKEDINAP